MKELVGTLAKNLVNLIYPLRCASCGKALEALDTRHVCGHCLGSIRPNPRPHCKSCGRPIQNARGICPDCEKSPPRFTRAYSAYLYEGALREMIHSFKYKNRVSLGVILSELMYEFIKAEGDVTKGVDVITAVPLGAWRRRQRGFNQAALLAANISKRTAISFGDILRKRRHTAYQNELSRDKRLTNLSGAFAVREGAAIGGLGILLIDDVMTTGATLEECSAVLLSAGAKAVTCLTLARGA